LSTAGDSIATIYGGYELLLGRGIPWGIPLDVFRFPNIGLYIVAMVSHIAAGFLVSIWISERKQLA